MPIPYKAYFINYNTVKVEWNKNIGKVSHFLVKYKKKDFSSAYIVKKVSAAKSSLNIFGLDVEQSYVVTVISVLGQVESLSEKLVDVMRKNELYL